MDSTNCIRLIDSTDSIDSIDSIDSAGSYGSTSSRASTSSAYSRGSVDPMDDWLTPDDVWWGISYIGQKRPFVINMPPLTHTFYDTDGNSETIDLETMRTVRTKTRAGVHGGYI
mgnify:CR=1 FL=1